MERLPRGLTPEAENIGRRLYRHSARIAAVIGIAALLDLARGEYEIQLTVSESFPSRPSDMALVDARQTSVAFHEWIADRNKSTTEEEDIVTLRRIGPGVNIAEKMLRDEHNRQQLEIRLHDENEPRKWRDINVAVVAGSWIIPYIFRKLIARNLLGVSEGDSNKSMTDEELESLHSRIQTLHSNPFDISGDEEKLFGVPTRLAQEMQLTETESKMFLGYFSFRLTKKLHEEQRQQGFSSEEEALEWCRLGRLIELTEKTLNGLLEEKPREFEQLNPQIVNPSDELGYRRWMAVTAQAGIFLANALWQQPPQSIEQIRSLLEMHTQEIQSEGREPEYIAA